MNKKVTVTVTHYIEWIVEVDKDNEVVSVVENNLPDEQTIVKELNKYKKRFSVDDWEDETVRDIF